MNKCNIVIGSKFGNWEVLEIAASKKYNNKTIPFVVAKCLCGTTREVNFRNLERGLSKSCGCVGNQKTIKRCTKHGYCKRANWTKEHKIWCGLFKRCYDKKSISYHRYGGAGVIVHERWHDFSNFIEDMGMIPEGKKSIDRFPNKFGNYEPGNCRWADDFEQSRNRSNNINVVVGGKTITAKEGERYFNLPKDSLRKRLKLGHTLDEAVNLANEVKNKKIYKNVMSNSNRI